MTSNEQLPDGWVRGTGAYEGQLWNGRAWVPDPAVPKTPHLPGAAAGGSAVPGPGWFVDPSDPLRERLWDGSQWTENTRVRPPTAGPQTGTRQPLPTPGGEPEQGRGRKVLGWVGVISIGLLAVLFQFGRGIWNSLDTSQLTSLSCSELADEAIRISEENNKGTIKPVLLRVDSTVRDLDRQSTATPPTTGETVVLKCHGVGYFNTNDNAPVTLTMSIDSRGDSWISYEVE